MFALVGAPESQLPSRYGLCRMRKGMWTDFVVFEIIRTMLSRPTLASLQVPNSSREAKRRHMRLLVTGKGIAI